MAKAPNMATLIRQPQYGNPNMGAHRDGEGAVAQAVAVAVSREQERLVACARRVALEHLGG
eukprot:3392780-Prymnesium_polylepis.2